LRYPLPVVAALLALTASLAPLSLAEEDAAWPRTIDTERGSILIYQPQFETFEGDTLTGRTAFSVTAKGADEPVFGVTWFSARVQTDRDTRTVHVLKTEITRVRFPNATEEQEQQFKELVESRAKTANLDMSLDRLLTSLAIVERETQAAQGLNFDPPVILYTEQPSVLITIDGEPSYRDAGENLERVVNSPFLIIHDTKKNRFYLDGGVAWYVADSIEGPWKYDKKPPKKVANLRPAEAQKAAEKESTKTSDQKSVVIMVATTPTELLVSDGVANYAPITGTDLLYMTNTEASIFTAIEQQRQFVVLSGRWYSSKGLDGPWSYVAPDDLPDDFAKIPPDSAMAEVLVYVPGTVEADDAAMDAQIPQTAALKRETVKLDISYDGTPEFKVMEGTQIEYAVNTGSAVLRVDGRYYACDQGAWYIAEGPTGPWMVSDHRPDGVDSIPPTNPHYNVKYVYVYSSTPEVVYVGYTPGYTGSYIYGGCVVYGTGWYYSGWYGPYSYPRPSTWGFRVSYNPYYGWSFGLSWSNGPFTIHFGRGGYGGYGRYGGYWGARGYYGRPPGYRPGRPGYRPPAYRPGNPGNLPSTRPGGPSTMPVQGGGRDNMYNRPENRERVASQPSNREQSSKNVANNRQNNVYSDRDGNVYRRNENGSWDQRSKDGWTPSDRSKSGQAPATSDRSRPSTSDNRAKPSSPSTANRSQPSTSNRSGSGGYSGASRDYNSRQRGNSRTGSYNRTRSSPSRSTGGSRGGGGRRR